MPPTTYRTTTIALAKVKAKHMANQAGLNRLQELLVKAASNPNNGQNYAITIKRALKSLQECKEPILTQKDAVKLKFVGPAMAKKICPQSTGVNTVNTTTTANDVDVDDDDDNNNNAKKRKAIPKCKKKNNNSNNNEDDAYKSTTTTTTATSIMEGIQQQQQQQQQQRSVPMVCPRPASSVISSSMARSASLSSSMSFGEIGPTAKQSAYAIAKAEAERLVLPSRGPWKIILLIDGREHKSKQVVSSCKQVGIPCEERHLAIGDMAWIARCVLPKDNSSNNQQQQQSTATATTSKKKRKKKNADDDDDRIIEILVGTIIERKDVADLASSLYGTRYAEQRLRLSQCGLPQVLFLVEGDLHSCSNCPSETLQMAMMETRVNLGFQIVQTKHLTDTVSVLKTLHSRIVQRTFPEAFGKTSKNSMALPTFGGGNRRDRGRGDRRVSSLLEMSFDTPPVPPFGSKRFITYPELKAKVEIDRERGTRSIRAITLAMLKQIPTLSHKKCTAMSNAYPTMNSLLDSLSYHNDGDPKTLIRNIEIENGRTIGPNSASEVYTACCTLEDGSTVASHGVGVPSSANPPMMMMMKPPPSTTAPPPLSVINSNNLINNSSNSNSNSNNINKNNRTKTTTAVAAVANNTKKSPPGMPASSVATARVIQKSGTNNGKNGVESSPKKMRMESINAAVTITTKNNSNVIVHKNITKSSSLQGKSSRKRPAADDCCDYDSDVILVSSPADKERLNRETTTKTTTAPKQEMVVDLLTPESSPKSNTTKRIAMSRSSNLTEGTYSNNATTATSTVKSKPLCVVKRRTPISTRGDDSFLFSSSDDDTPHRRPIASRKSAITTTININNNNNNNNNKPAFITGMPSTNNDDTIDNMNSASSSKRRKTPAKTSGRRSSLSSSDGSSYLFSSPEESPFPPARSIDNSNDNVNDNFDNEERKMSPAKNLSFQNLKSNNNNNVSNNNDVGVTGVVSLLDDDDDDDGNKAGIGNQKQRYENEMQEAIRASLNNDTPSTTASSSSPSADKIIARKVSNESLSPSSSQSSSSPSLSQSSSTIGIKRDDKINDGIGGTRTPPGVTTKRGGGCGNTFSAASSTFTCSSDGVDSNNNDPAAAAVDTTTDTDTDTDGSPQFYKSLRERLCNKIPGKKIIIQEVIELDFDSD